MNRGDVRSGLRRRDRRIESLGVPDREHRLSLARQPDQLVGLRHRASQRLLNQDRHSSFQKRARDGAVRFSWCRDHHAVHSADEFGRLTDHLSAVDCRQSVQRVPD